MRAEALRTDVGRPLIWKRPPRGEPLTETIARVVRQNPIFTDAELAEKGRDYAECLPRMVSSGIVKKQGTHVYSAHAVDQAHRDVQLLLGLTGSRPATPASLERHAARLAVRDSRTAARRALAPRAERLAAKRARVFDFEDAAEMLGGDPSDAIMKLVATNRLMVVHPRLYRRPGVAEHGPEMVAWIERRAERDRLAMASIDASCRLHPGAGGRREPMRVTSMRIDEPEGMAVRRRTRVYVNLNHMGAIYATAGGPGNGLAVWNSHADRRGVTREAAEMVAAEIFPRFMPWGDLLAAAKLHAADRGVAENLPAIRRRGRLDEAPRGRETTMRARMDRLREIDRRTPLLPGPCVLHVDHREDQNVVDALTGIANLAVVQVKLDDGDFHARWGEGPRDDIVIERKADGDYAASVADGRLERQVARLGDIVGEGRRACLLIQGDVFDRDPVEVGARARGAPLPGNLRIMKTTVDVAMRGVPMVLCENWTHTAEAVLMLVVASMRETLPGAGGGHTTAPCATPGPTAAEPSAAPSSASTRSDAAASPDT